MTVATPKQTTHRNWDVIEPESLLPLVGVRKTTDRFGVLLRHYWLPDTVLTYESTIRQQAPSGVITTKQLTMTRRQVSCDADSCCWRETIKGDDLSDVIQFAPNADTQRFCTYNRSEQTFRAQPILGRTALPENVNEARVQAFLNQPILTPLLPIPIEFRWHIESDDGFLEFSLESETLVGDMPVVTVRRHGEFWVDAWFQGGQEHHGRLKIRQEGVTTFATERSVVLADKVNDIVLEAENNRMTGLEMFSDLRLVRSEVHAEKAVTPLYFPYQTNGDNTYMYDCGTGRILKSGNDFQPILVDYHRLHPLEIYQKHSEFEPERITAALNEIERLRSEGYLVDHKPDELSRVDKIVYEKELHDVGDFCRSTGSLLVLGITERCNLDCAYCCFSGKFAGQRTHSQRTIKYDVAKKAISDYLNQKSSNTDDLYRISFYGGEPLLEQKLLVDCVEFAKYYAGCFGKKVRFSITTNGTLLDDAAVDFLLENEFLILISLDGPRESHDRYRVFPNGKGSFETIDGNLKRFVERYPRYEKRGLNFTLAPPLDLEGTEKLLEEMISDFPLSRIAMVNTGLVSQDASLPTTRYGCRTTCPKSETSLESFQEYGPEDRQKLLSLEAECVENLALYGSMEARKRNPFSTHLVEGRIESYHKRSVQKKAPEHPMFVPCLPGLTRRFCDVEGNYRVCERVDDSQAFLLGNVWDGLDPEKLERVLELRRHMGDCANCVSLKTCGLCYARIPNGDGAGNGLDPAFDQLCRQNREIDKRMFSVYTGIMERNPKAFERPSSSSPPDTKTIYYATQTNRLDDAVLEKLRCEKRD